MTQQRQRRLRTTWWRHAERGNASIEYAGMIVVGALMVMAMIAVLVAMRFEIGAAMAQVHARDIHAFSYGAPGQGNFGRPLYPVVGGISPANKESVQAPNQP